MKKTVFFAFLFVLVTSCNSTTDSPKDTPAPGSSDFNNPPEHVGDGPLNDTSIAGGALNPADNTQDQTDTSTRKKSPVSE